MKIKNLLTLTACAATCGLSSLAIATENLHTNPVPSQTDLTGFYLGAGAGYGVQRIQDYHIDGIGENDLADNQNFVGRVFAGYQLNPHFALEAGYTLFPKNYRTRVSRDYVATFFPEFLNDENFDWRRFKKTKAIDLALKAQWPIYHKLNFHLKVGGNYLISTKNMLKITYGAGFEWQHTQNVAVGLAWQRFHSDHNVHYCDSCNPNYDRCFLLAHADTFMATIRYNFAL